MANSTPSHLLVIFGFNRIDKLRNRLMEIREIAPPNILISIDFLNPETTAEFNALLESEVKSWPKNSVLEFKLQTQNLGLVSHITKTVSESLLSYEFVIIVEDDIMISKGFYDSALVYMTEDSLANEYASFSGYSILPAYKGMELLNFLRETPYFACWGWVIARENWKDYKVDISGEKINENLQNSVVWNALNLKQKETWLGRFRKAQENPWNTWDIQFQYHTFKLDKFNLAPTWRIVENDGFNDSRSTHTQNIRPKIMGKIRFSTEVVKSELLPKFLNRQAIKIESQILYQDSRQFFNIVKAFQKIFSYRF